MDTGFPDDNSSATPETYSNPNGVPSIFTSGTWSAMVDSHLGVWDIADSGYMRVDNPDFNSSMPFTAIYVQVIYNGGGTYQPDLTVNGVAGTLVSHQNLSGLGKWEYGQWSFTLLSNPSSELIAIDGNVKIDQVMVNTYAVPEPGAGLLVALGAGLVLAARRRARR